jgi:hypothetical protein
VQWKKSIADLRKDLPQIPALAINGFSFFQSCGSNEIAYTQSLFLGCLNNFRGFLFGVIGKQCPSGGTM